jgi:membrane protein
MQWLITFEPLALIVQGAPRLLPFILSLATFTFLYAFIPNTRVAFSSALIGGITATILWKISGWAVASFVTNSPNLTAIYSTFVGIILFLIWLYVGWVITLVGASIAFYHQHPEYLGFTGHSLKLSNRMKEQITLLTLFWIGQNHYQRQTPWTIAKLAKKVGISTHHMTWSVMTLKDAGLLTPSQDEPPRFTPGYPFGTTSVYEALQAVRTADEDRFISPNDLILEPVTWQLMKGLDRAAQKALHELTLKDFVLTEVEARHSAKKG